MSAAVPNPQFLQDQENNAIDIGGDVHMFPVEAGNGKENSGDIRIQVQPDGDVPKDNAGTEVQESSRVLETPQANSGNEIQEVDTSVGNNTGQIRIRKLFKAIGKNDSTTFKSYMQGMVIDTLRTAVNNRGETFLHIATEKGNVELVEKLVKGASLADLERRDSYGNNALITAATVGNAEIVRLIVESKEQLTSVTDKYGRLPIVAALRNGNKDVAEYLYTKTPLNTYLYPPENGAHLVVAAILSDMYDIALDVLQRHKEFAFICDNRERTALAVLAEKPSAFRSGCHFGIWEELIYRVITLPSTKGASEGSAQGDNKRRLSSHCGCYNYNYREYIWKILRKISGLRIRKVYDQKLMHSKVRQILKIITGHLASAESDKLQHDAAYNSILEASKCGIVEMVSALSKYCSEWNSDLDKEGKHIFEWALLERQEHVFNLIYDLRYKKMITLSRDNINDQSSNNALDRLDDHSSNNALDNLGKRKDKHHNNFLHTAGSETPQSLRDRISGAAFLMQREMQWFKEVERLVPPRYKTQKNKEGKTPRQLFTKNHKDDLEAGEKWMKETSQACMVVATLIATVVFASAFTVPGGNDNNTGIPVFRHYSVFHIFILSDAVSFISSLTSTLMFLAVLTSRFAEEDFLFSLPNKMILGLTSLFISIVSMIGAFSAALFIIFRHKSIWIPILSVAFAGTPIFLFIVLQFPLLFQMVSSTYFSSIFGKKRKGKRS